MLLRHFVNRWAGSVSSMMPPQAASVTKPCCKQQAFRLLSSVLVPSQCLLSCGHLPYSTVPSVSSTPPPATSPGLMGQAPPAGVSWEAKEEVLGVRRRGGKSLTSHTLLYFPISTLN